MEIVQVLVPVPEVGDIILTLARYERGVMALEAQGELLRRECTRVSFRVVGGHEQLGLGGRVGSVAIGTLAFCNGRMDLIVELSVDLVAFPAQRGLVAQEKGTVFRCVGSVAVGTASVRDRLVNHGAVVNHAVVAFLTQSFGRPGQKLGMI